MMIISKIQLQIQKKCMISLKKKHKDNIEINYVKHALMDMHYVFNDIYCSDDVDSKKMK